MAAAGSWLTSDRRRLLAANELPDQLEQPARVLGIELTGRLVREEEAGAVGERRADGDPLLLAAGQLGRMRAPTVEQSHALEQLVGPRDHAPAGPRPGAPAAS